MVCCSLWASRHHAPWNATIGWRAWRLACAVAAVVSAAGCLDRQASVGLWFERDACVLRPGSLERFGEVLSDEERRTVQSVARDEAVRAFSSIRLRISAEPAAFWRIGVVRSLPTRSGRALPRSGESVALGVFGGGGTVACDVVARKAVRYAPADATRAEVVQALGRGVGRTAVHEVVHQLLGPFSAHNDEDVDSYEHGSSDRVSQYYGELHWSSALPLLQQKFGLADPQ